MILTPEELRLKCRDYIDAAVWEDWFNGKMYTEVRTYLSSKTINTCVDIGAATGMATGYMLYYFNPTKMICFEPDHENFLRLTENIKHSQVQSYNVGILYGYRETQVYGVGDNNPLGYMSSAVEPQHYASWGEAVQPYEGKTFNFVELEEIVNVADLIKIDVEGSEYNIIEHSTLVKETPWLLLETHNHERSYIEQYLKENLPHRIVASQGEGIHLGFFLERT